MILPDDFDSESDDSWGEDSWGGGGGGGGGWKQEKMVLDECIMEEELCQKICEDEYMAPSFECAAAPLPDLLPCSKTIESIPASTLTPISISTPTTTTTTTTTTTPTPTPTLTPTPTKKPEEGEKKKEEVKKEDQETERENSVEEEVAGDLESEVDFIGLPKKLEGEYERLGLDGYFFFHLFLVWIIFSFFSLISLSK